MDSNIAHVLQRADSASRRRDRSRGNGRAKNENDRNGRNGRGDRGRKGRRDEKKAVDNQQNEVIRENAS